MNGNESEKGERLNKSQAKSQKLIDFHFPLPLSRDMATPLDKLPPHLRAKVEAADAQQNGKRRAVLGLAPLAIDSTLAQASAYAAIVPASMLAIQREAAPRERRVKQARNELNKLEAAYEHVLRAEFPGVEIRAQSIRLRLGNGIWYKPDFFIPSANLFVEVKGPHAHRGGLENLKVAAGEHDWAEFRLVWREGKNGRGQWLTQKILP